MKLCVLCSTYNRPHLLSRTIACFESQDYEDRYMVIYDDAGQYGDVRGDRWHIHSENARCKSLGEKRNKAMELAPKDTYAVLPIDDDDLFLPWHLSAAAKVLENADWSRPSIVLSPIECGNTIALRRNYTGCREDNTKNRLYHPAWAFRLDIAKKLGGYPDNLSGPEDQGLMRKMEEAGVKEGDQIELGIQPSYIYCWGNGNISGMLNRNDKTGCLAWEKIGSSVLLAPILNKWNPDFDIHNPPILPHVSARPF